MNTNLNIAAYGEGILCPPNLAANMEAIQQAGWTSVMVSLFQVNTAGDISIGDIVINGSHKGDPEWAQQLEQLKSGGTIKTLLATFGGWDNTFKNIQYIYDNNNNSFDNTALKANCEIFKNAFPAFDLIDMDVEYPDGQPLNASSCFIAFCRMWIELGYGITFCPYGDTDFWIDALVAIENTNPGAVKWFNLQCYAGGAGQQPSDWATAITSTLPGFNTDNYILASDWTRFWDVESYGSFWNGDCPTAVQALLSPFNGEACVGGGFLWTIDQIIDYAAQSQKHPDPESCGQVGMTDYINAIVTALKTS